jgi:3-phenylpropionate/trans-cinnamate dioxygenase ferredoxin subunit
LTILRRSSFFIVLLYFASFASFAVQLLELGSFMSDWITVAKVGELVPGSHRVVDADGTRVVVFNLGGEYYAIEDVCTHDGGQLTGGVIEGEQIVCPRHGARFCIRTGEALTAPAYEPVATLPVRVENGVIQVRDNRWD